MNVNNVFFYVCPSHVVMLALVSQVSSYIPSIRSLFRHIYFLDFLYRSVQIQSLVVEESPGRLNFLIFGASPLTTSDRIPY